MFEGVINEILKFGGQLLDVIRQLNSWVLNNFGGVLLIVATLAAIAAWRKASKANKNADAMQNLANAIIRQYNKELKEG